MTTTVPAASESGMFRRGSFTSPAVNVMLFHASDEKREPTCETQKAINNPKTPLAAVTSARDDKSGLIVPVGWGVQKLLKFAFITSALRPMNNPMKINASSDNVFADVNMF